MSKTVKHKHEPFFHISKRASIPFLKGLAIRAVGILIAIAICILIITLLMDLSPIEVCTKMIDGNFKTKQKVWKVFQNTAILLCISLAVTPAFKMKFWNIGAEGQVLVGCIATAGCMIYLGQSLPSYILFPIMFITAVASGALWALIPAIFKAKYNTNETLFTLMMNYVAIQFVAFLQIFWENKKGSCKIGLINMYDKKGWIPQMFGSWYFWNIVIVAVLTIIVFVYLKYTKQGYEISVVGESHNTARYIGINVKKVIIRTMLISGAICGLAGMLLVSGTHHSLATDTAGGQGFTAIIVSWLAKFNPLTMVLTSFLIVFLELGAGEVTTLSENLADVLVGVVLFVIIGFEFFTNYKISFRHKEKEVDA